MSRRWTLVVIVALALSTCHLAYAQSPEEWYREGRAAVERAKKLKPITTKAKNVILFVGDGMGVTTVTAARIMAGQQRGETGEENRLSFEELPYTALIKTYNVDQQSPDSAGTMTAIVTGVKSKAWMISVNQKVTHGDHKSAKGNELTTILELAEKAGLATGIVTTTKVTHATPAACYAHSPDRAWEMDAYLPADAKADGFPDIARQLIEFSVGDGLEVVLGGGRQNFMPNTATDPEYPDRKGMRGDHRDLTAEWLGKARSAYVWTRADLAAIDPATTDHLLGLFEPGHMSYAHDRDRNGSDDPSLVEMTAKAIDLLAKKNKGYFLMVEGGRIDHAHHANNAYRALTDTIEFADAVRVAMQKTDRAKTLIIVTADHSHLLTMGGYPKRGNPILGKVVVNDTLRTTASGLALDGVGRPYTTLTYPMGPGYTGASDEQPEGPKTHVHRGRKYQYATLGRVDLTKVDTTVPDYLMETAIPADDAEHGGADVALYADGPRAYLFRGVLEQNVIFHVMVEALELERAGIHSKATRLDSGR